MHRDLCEEVGDMLVPRGYLVATYWVQAEEGSVCSRNRQPELRLERPHGSVVDRRRNFRDARGVGPLFKRPPRRVDVCDARSGRRGVFAEVAIDEEPYY